MALPRIRFVARPAATLEPPVKRNAGPAVETRLPWSLASSVRDALSVAFRAFGRVSGRKASSTTDLTPFGGYVEALSSHKPPPESAKQFAGSGFHALVDASDQQWRSRGRVA